MDDAPPSELKSSGSFRIDHLSDADALASLNSAPQGLSAAEARRRLREFGPNHVEELRREHPLLRFLKGLTHFFALILWVAAALAFLAEWRAPGEGMAKVGYAIVVVMLVSAVFAFWQEHRAERTLATLRQLLPQQAAVVREGKVAQLPIEQLVPGDIVVLEQGAYFGGLPAHRGVQRPRRQRDHYRRVATSGP
jgi:sodium/potassium-transporting ATPase subunit alpha